jgi:hypothetical protein
MGHWRLRLFPDGAPDRKSRSLKGHSRCASINRTHAFRSGCTKVLADPGEMMARCGAQTTVPDWRERLICSGCGSRQVDFVVTGTERR